MPALERKKYWRMIFLVVAVALVLAWETSPTYSQICEQDKAGHENCSAYYTPLAWLWHIAKVLDDHAGAIGAVATVFIGWFTFTLYGATDKLRDISDRQVRVTENAERPWLLMHKYQLRQQERTSEMVHNNWYISFEWRNFGRIPAVIETSVATIQDQDTLSDTPDYSKCQTLDMKQHTVAANETCMTREFGPSIKFKPDGTTPIRYVVYGLVTYRDLSGKPHKAGFAMDVWSVAPAANMYGGDKYNYQD